MIGILSRKVGFSGSNLWYIELKCPDCNENFALLICQEETLEIIKKVYDVTGYAGDGGCPNCGWVSVKFKNGFPALKEGGVDIEELRGPTPSP